MKKIALDKFEMIIKDLKTNGETELFDDNIEKIMGEYGDTVYYDGSEGLVTTEEGKKYKLVANQIIKVLEIDMNTDEEYKTFKPTAGSSLYQTVNTLLLLNRFGVKAYADFNGNRLYSDKVTVDGAYKDIIGKTKAEHDKEQEDWRENYRKQEEEHEAKIPELTEVWRKKGREILTEDRWEKWDKIVPVRLSDLYHGMELGCCLDIVKILNDNGTLDEAKEKIESQGHSGMSFSLVRIMVKEFCSRGEEFSKYID